LHVVLARYDVALYLNSANGPFGALLRASRTRSAINVDGLEWLRPKWRGIGARYFRFASRLATRFFDEIVTDARAMAAVYEREFGSRSTTIAYGSTPTRSTAPERLSEFGLVARDYYLIVGRLIPDNNADLLVRGFCASESKRKLVIVGDTPYHDDFAQSVRSIRDDRLIFTGYVRDQELLRELYCNAHAYLHGHEFGGTNPSLLHALAAGCCVLALDTPFSREVLENDEHGIYFQKTEASVRETISRIDCDEARVETLRARARDRVSRAYTWESVVDDYEKLLLRLAPR
jgi:glycosyltransferase involved in cell wall biosynthesis